MEKEALAVPGMFTYGYVHGYVRLAATQAQQPPEPQVGAQATESNVQNPKTDGQ